MDKTIDLFSLIKIKELLEEYADICRSNGYYYQNDCTHCMEGDCKVCYEPEFETARACKEMISEIDAVINGGY